MYLTIGVEWSPQYGREALNPVEEFMVHEKIIHVTTVSIRNLTTLEE